MALRTTLGELHPAAAIWASAKEAFSRVLETHLHLHRFALRTLQERRRNLMRHGHIDR
jgi:hypothetical protein